MSIILIDCGGLKFGFCTVSRDGCWLLRVSVAPLVRNQNMILERPQNLYDHTAGRYALDQNRPVSLF